MTVKTKYSAEINYKMRLPLSIFCSFQQRGAKYNNLELDDNELVADGIDEIGFIAYVTRNDDPDKKQLKDAKISRIDLVIDDETETPAFDYEIVLDNGSKPGKFGRLSTPAEKVKGIVKSNKPLSYTKENVVTLKMVFYADFDHIGNTSTGEKTIIPYESLVIYPK